MIGFLFSRFFKINFIFALLLLFSVSLIFSADDKPHVIGEVKVNIEGKTNSSILKKDLALVPFAEKYLTTDLLEENIEERKKFLFNKRIFEKVDYAIELMQTTEEYYIYSVTFTVVDGLTTLLIPVLKYDSNYGAKGGIKLYDTNLFGLLTDLKINSGIRQLNPTSFNNYEFITDFDLRQMQFFDHRFDISLQIEIDSLDGRLQNGAFKGEAKLFEISIGPTSINFYSDIKLTQFSDETISLWADPTINLGFIWKDIPFIDKKITHLFNFNFYKDGLSWKLPELTFTNQLSSHLFNVQNLQFNGSLKNIIGYKTENQSIITNNIDFTISSSFTLFENIKQSVSLSLLTQHAEALFEDIEIATINTFTHGRIDWIDNFREGHSIKLTINTLTPANKGWTEVFSSFETNTIIEASYFTLLSENVNFSFRGVGYLSNYSKKNPFYPGEYMRGILDANLPQKNGYAGLSFNTNLNINFFDFTIYIWDLSPDGKFYLSPFFDFSLFKNDPFGSNTELTWIEYSGGLELYVIFDSFRSYPLAATFGTNLKDVVAWQRGDKNFRDIEFEIIIALGLFY